MSEWNCLVCKEFKKGIACTFCDDGSKFVRITNADRIRNFSDEELAEFLVKVNSAIQNCMIVDCKNEGIDRDCKDCFLEWLQTEVKEGENDG